MARSIIYTSFDGFINHRYKVESYTMLNESFVDWINERSYELLSNITHAEKLAGDELISHFECVERQVFFLIHGRCYFLDYYIPNIRTAIEIDGKYHEDRKKQDALRDSDFNDIGIRTIRIKAKDVLSGNFIETLSKKLQTRNKLPKTDKKPKKVKATKKGTKDRKTKMISQAMRRVKEHDKYKHLSTWI